MVQGLDSSTMRPGQLATASVVRSTNDAIVRTTAASVQLIADPSGSGYTVQLAGLFINGQMVRTASSGVALDGLIGKVMNFGRKPGAPPLAVSGTRVFLLQDTQVKFSLTQPPIQASPVVPQQRASQESPRQPTPAATTWQLHDLPNNAREATLLGVTESGGRRVRALLAVSCTISHFTSTPVPSASVSYELRIPRGVIGFPTESLGCEGDGGGNDYGRFQLGTEPETKGDFCYDGELPQKLNETVAMQLVPNDLKAPIQAPGTTFYIGLRMPNTQNNVLNARFQLPADAVAVDAMLDPCFKLLDEAERKEKAAIVVSCPVLPDKTLRDVSVLVGPAMTKLAADPDNDIGVAWNLPKKTKARPIPPKTTLACYYGSGPAPKTPTQENFEKKLLPIPANAAYCVFREDGHCSTNQGTN